MEASPRVSGDEQETVDSGRRRTIADNLAMTGFSYGSDVAAAACHLLRYEAQGRDLNPEISTGFHVAPRVILAWARSYPEIEESPSWVRLSGNRAILARLRFGPLVGRHQRPGDDAGGADSGYPFIRVLRFAASLRSYDERALASVRHCFIAKFAGDLLSDAPFSR